MRIITSLRGVALGLALASPLAAGIAATAPAQAQIEDTIWRDQARIAAHTAPAPASDPSRQVASGRSVTASDAAPALVGAAPSNDPMVNGAGVPMNPKTGVALPGFSDGGF